MILGDLSTVKLPTKTSLYRQLKECGVGKPTLKRILPTWWNDELLSTASGLAEFSLFIKLRLGLNFVFDQEQGSLLFEPPNTPIQFKKRASTSIQKLYSAAFISQAVGRTILRQLRKANVTQDTHTLYEELISIPELSLKQALEILWVHHIPVVYVDGYSTSMARPAGMVMREYGLFTIILSHKHKSPATQLFVLLHEVGHILAGHLPDTGTISDSTLSELGESLREENDEQELHADQIALNILRKEQDIEQLLISRGRCSTAVDLALLAKQSSSQSNINSGHLILSYGRLYRDWILAHQALKFIEKEEAQVALKKHNELLLKSLEVKASDLDFLQAMLSI